MTEPVLHAPPRLRDVVLEQIRVVALALRWQARAALALTGLATLLVARDLLAAPHAIPFHPEHQMLPGVVGLLLTIAVWKGEEPFGASFLWTLPVDRRQQALARVFAGWVWLMTAVALFVLWLLALTLVSGANILADEPLRVLRVSIQAHDRLVPGAFDVVRWAARPVFWLVPFTAATGTYLLGSAVALGTRHPLRWITGAVLALLLVGVVGKVANAEWLMGAPERIVRWIEDAPYGVDTLLTARTESLKIEGTLDSGESVVVWRALPDLRVWATATVLWTMAGLLALWAAASRHGECRRN